MKQTLLFILSIYSYCMVSAKADSTYVWNKWCANKDTLLLFAKANNMIQIYSTIIDLNNVILKPMDKTLKLGKPEIRKDTLSVMAMPYATGEKKMRLVLQDKKTKKTIKTLSFTGTDIPEPKAYLGNLQAKEAAKKDILAQFSLKVVFPNSLYCYPYKIKEYIFKIYSCNTADSILVTGSVIPKEVVKDIFSSPTGSTIEFSRIKALCPDCDMRIMNEIKIKVK